MRIKEKYSKNIIVLNADTSIYEVANAMKKYRIGFVPIAKNKKIVGVVTDRDIIINCVANKCDNNEKIGAYINKNVISIDCNREINEAITLMKTKKVKRLVVTCERKVVGVLSISDILEMDKDKIVDAIKDIWSIENKELIMNPEVDEFYL